MERPHHQASCLLVGLTYEYPNTSNEQKPVLPRLLEDIIVNERENSQIILVPP